MQPLDLKSIEERPLPPSKRQKQVTVRFTYEGSPWWKNGAPIVWKKRYLNQKAAEQAILDATTREGLWASKLLSAEIV